MRPDAVEDLLVAISEAVTNAVLHGAAADAGAIPDVVKVELITRGDRVVIAITSPRSRWAVPDDALPSDPLDMSGPRFFLMRQFADSVRIKQGRRGTTVYLTKRAEAKAG